MHTWGALLVDGVETFQQGHPTLAPDVRQIPCLLQSKLQTLECFVTDEYM